MSRPFSARSSSPGSFVRINGKIRAREVRVIGPESQQLGILALHEAISLARSRNMDLVEVAPNATPPVCRIVDYGKFRYEQSKKEKESKKHQHATRVKEIQLSASIDPHDYEVKLGHAVDFLCEDMKVKVSLRFRGREMAHQQYGQQVVDRLIKAVVPYGQPDAPPKLIGKGLSVMLSPLPRAKRAKHPKGGVDGQAPVAVAAPRAAEGASPSTAVPIRKPAAPEESVVTEEAPADGFGNTPFAELEAKLSDRTAA